MKRNLRFILARYISFDDTIDVSKSHMAFYKIFEPLTIKIKGFDKTFKAGSIILNPVDTPLTVNHRLMYYSPSISYIARTLKERDGLQVSHSSLEIDGVKFYVPYYEVQIGSVRQKVVTGKKYTTDTEATLSGLIQYLKDKNNDFI